MLEVWIERVKVLGNISIEKWQSVVLIVQQDANPCGGNGNSDVWCHPAVQEFIFVPVGKKHSQIPKGALLLSKRSTLCTQVCGRVFHFTCVLWTVPSLLCAPAPCLLPLPLRWAMAVYLQVSAAFLHNLIPQCSDLPDPCNRPLLHVPSWLQMAGWRHLGKDEVRAC